jgi:hypothetical protein
MTNHAINQLGGNAWDLAGQEAVAWTAFASFLGLQDCKPALPHAIHHTLQSGSTPHQQTLKRLDHFFTSAALTGAHPRLTSRIVATQVLLDHSLVVLSLSRG